MPVDKWPALGGDLAFLNSIAGLASCSATYPCVRCKVNKDELHKDATFDPRTYEEACKLAHC